MTECNSQIDLLTIGGRMLTARFEGETLTSDAGVVFVGAADKRLSLTKRLSKALTDRRSSRRVLPDILKAGVKDLLVRRCCWRFCCCWSLRVLPFLHSGHRKSPRFSRGGKTARSMRRSPRG